MEGQPFRFVKQMEAGTEQKSETERQRQEVEKKEQETSFLLQSVKERRKREEINK